MAASPDDSDLRSSLASVYQGAFQGTTGLLNVPLSLEMLLAAPITYLALADDLPPDWPQQLVLLSGSRVLAIVRQLREDRRQRLLVTPDFVLQALTRATQQAGVRDELRGLGRQLQGHRAEVPADPAVPPADDTLQEAVRKLREEWQEERKEHHKDALEEREERRRQIEDAVAKLTAREPKARWAALGALGAVVFHSILGNEATKAIDASVSASGHRLAGLRQVGEPSRPYTFVSQIGGTRGNTPGQFYGELNVAVDLHDNLYVVESGNGRIQKFGPDGRFLTQIGTSGSGPGQLDSPTAVAIDAQDNLYIADAGNNRVLKFGPDGHYLTQILRDRDAPSKVRSSIQAGPRTNGVGPFMVAVDSQGNLYVPDAYSFSIRKFGPDSHLLGRINTSRSAPYQELDVRCVAIDRQGNLYATDSYRPWIRKFGPDGRVLTQIEDVGSATGQFYGRLNVAIGPHGNLYVADSGNGRVQKFGPDGRFLAQVGTRGSGPGQLGRPGGIAVDAQGTVYVADSDNYRIQRFSPS